MKTLISILVSLILGMLTTKAQTTTTTSSSSSTNVTVTVKEDEKKYYRSFAVIDMDNTFRIKVRFIESLEDEVKTYLIDQFGKENMIIDDHTYLWKKEVDEEEVYEVRLKENRLRINVNKELASDKLFKKFEQIGKELKSVTSKEESK